MSDIPGISHISKKQNVATMLVCITGIAMNMVYYMLVTAFGLPLYLDTVGTVAVAVMGGYLPGVIVGYP